MGRKFGIHCAIALVLAVFFAAIPAVADVYPYVSVKGGTLFFRPRGFFDSDGIKPGSLLDPTPVPGGINMCMAGAKFAFGFLVDAEEFRGRTRAELEIGFSARDEKSFPLYIPPSSTTGEQTTLAMQSDTLMVNLYYDIRGTKNFRPYVGCGIGCARITPVLRYGPTFSWMGRDIIGLTCQIGAGVSYSLGGNVEVDFGYRYVLLPPIRGWYTHQGWEIAPDIRSRNHEFLFGLRYIF